MNFLNSLFRRRPDGRAEPRDDIAQLERQLNERLAERKRARSIANPHQRGHVTRQINAGAQ